MPITIHQKTHNDCREEEQQNGNGFVETAFVIVFQYGFSASAVYSLNPAMSCKNDGDPYERLYHCDVREKPDG